MTADSPFTPRLERPDIVAIDRPRASEVAVIGAGAMGQGVAAACARAGIRAKLYDNNPAQLDRAMQVTHRRRRPSDAEVLPATSINEAVAKADLVIESVPEILAVKQTVLTAAAEMAPDDAVLATNTSHLSITDVASGVIRPQRVIGLHFFNPPPAMDLVEVIPALQTDPVVVSWAIDFVEHLGKRATMSRDVPGFIATRAHVAQFLECVRLVEEGTASVEDIDATFLIGFRHPMGPLELGDHIGLDVLLHIAEGMSAAHGARYRPPALLRQLVAAGRLGTKAGRGFYTYPRSSGSAR